MTKQNLEEFKTIEKVKLSYLRNKGNILAVLKELNWPEDSQHVDYLKKLVKKFKGQEEKDVSVLISNTLMSHVLFGSQSRTLHLMDLLGSLSKEEKPFVSACCKSHYRDEKDDGNVVVHRCMSCKATCEIYQPPKASIYNIKLKILEQLMNEDISLVEMAEKMGYTNKVESNPTIINHSPNVLVLNNKNSNSSDSDEETQKIIDDYSKLPPLEKARLVEKLHKEIIAIDAETIEQPKQQEEQSLPSTDTLSESN